VDLGRLAAVLDHDKIVIGKGLRIASGSARSLTEAR
jgi:hypothetical protein